MQNYVSMLCCPAGDVTFNLNLTNLKDKYYIVNIFAQTPVLSACEFLDCLWFVMRLWDSSLIV